MKKFHNNQERVLYLDILRILATLAVITIHVSASNWYTTKPSSYEWNIFNFYDSIVRWAVPIFVMISGAVFLDEKKEINIKKLYSKNILKIITSFLFWSLFYVMPKYMYFKNINDFIEKVMIGHYHLWFLYMIVGLYIITPFLRKITQEEKLMKYFLIIAICFTILLPTTSKIPFLSLFSKIPNKMNLNFQYITYFVLGHYLNTKEISYKNRKIIYFFSFIGFITTIFGSSIIANYKMEPYGLYNEFLGNVFLESVGIFLIIKNLKLNISTKQQKRIDLLVNNSFGIYLVHVFIIELLQKNSINTLTLNPLFSVPIIVLLTYLISLLISILIHKLPIFNKYIV